MEQGYIFQSPTFKIEVQSVEREEEGGAPKVDQQCKKNDKGSLLLLPAWCVEHVVVHELCHLLEPSHNARFHALMDKYFPRWKEARRQTRQIQAKTEY